MTGRTLFVGRNPRTVIEAESGEQVAEFWGRYAERDAKQFVASSDLLEAAKAAREFFGKHPAISGGIFAIELAKKLDAAIAASEDCE